MTSEINCLEGFFNIKCPIIRLKNIMLLAYSFFEYNPDLSRLTEFNTE
jgi:hypothetical protein